MYPYCRSNSRFKYFASAMKKTIAITLFVPLALLVTTHPPIKRFSSYVLYEISRLVEPNITSCESKPKPRQKWADEYKYHYLGD